MKKLKGFQIYPSSYEKMVADIPELASWGANIVRWQMVHGEDTMNGDEYISWLHGRLDLLEQCLPILKANRVHVILAMMSPPRTDRNPFTPESVATFHKSWEIITKRFFDNSMVSHYDLMNEPPTRTSAEVKIWNTMADKAFKIIRKYDKNKTIVKSTPYGDPQKVNKTTIPDDHKWMLTTHMYYPANITHQGVDPKYPVGKIWNSNVKKLEKYLEDVINFKEAPVLMGEFSCSIFSAGNNRYTYLKDCLDIWKKHNLDWCYHAFREAPCWDLESGDSAGMNLIKKRLKTSLIAKALEFFRTLLTR